MKREKSPFAFVVIFLSSLFAVCEQFSHHSLTYFTPFPPFLSFQCFPTTSTEASRGTPLFFTLSSLLFPLFFLVFQTFCPPVLSNDIPPAGAYPSVVYIKVSSKLSCSGVVLDRRTILTAAICFSESMNTSLLREYFRNHLFLYPRL